MKLYHPDETVTSCSFDGQTIEREEDGSFDAPDGAVELLHHGFTTQKPGALPPASSGPQGDHDDDDETGDDVLVKLAKSTRADIAAYAKQAYGADLDPIRTKKDDLLLAVAKLAADKAARVQAEEEAKAARLAEEEVAELAALKPAPAVEE